MYEDVVFDLHFYQCFGPSWTGLSARRHLQEAQKRADDLKRLPTCCVSEWSLALPKAATQGLDAEALKTLQKNFAEKQLEAYESATHGWFFWTWR
eukprot:CAMPEP_0180790060 /NCGR_PEP_ID=MMETSP1038_2-20121128/52998_1 /TAXON_ID=632150 /ORGANISM="Azadinium spinosum, Strain 3D9" /LENGTH=94 /DNA_ID=CAMNT_0022827955 /DNA_START=1 /DNA_END=282 /DNA_ORIENTATION=+